MSADLELRRKALLTTGWKFYADENRPYSFLFVPPGDESLMKYVDGYRLKETTIPLERLEGNTPAVESDPGASEPWFLEWCEKNGFQWDLYSTRSGAPAFSCAVYRVDHNGTMAHVFGTTPSEARAKAVIAAKEQA